MTATLTLSAALLLGLAASGHCLVMCGGISGALGVATAQGARGRPRPTLLVAYQLGRIASYTLAGLAVGGALGGVVGWLDNDAVRIGLRALSALALLLGALVAFGRLRDASFGLGARLWRKLAPIGRKLVPVTSVPRALAFGMVWGFMPCGFVYTVLVIAALQFDALGAAFTMAAFGIGTMPAMLATAFGASRAGSWSRLVARDSGRRVAGSILVAGAALTLAGPWLANSVPWLHEALPWLCTVPGT